MENYTEWFNNKMYEGHVRRLTEIKEKQTKMVKTMKNFRIKSEPSKSQQNIKKEFLPLPLVSKHQRHLLGQVVKQRTMNLKQKQSLLENYLLSRRILQTHSVFDSKLLKKQYDFHRKVSQNMNRNLQQNRRTFSELRKKKFSQLQKLKEQNYLGEGKVCFSIKVNEIMVIKRRLEENNESRFSLIYKPEKFKSYPVRALTFTQLISRKHYFRATKKQADKLRGLKFQIEEIRGTKSFKLGEFSLHLELKSKHSQSSQIEIQSKVNPEDKSENEKLKESQVINTQMNKMMIEKLLHPVTKYLIGTVEFIVEYKELSTG